MVTHNTLHTCCSSFFSSGFGLWTVLGGRVAFFTLCWNQRKRNETRSRKQNWKQKRGKMKFQQTWKEANKSARKEPSEQSQFVVVWLVWLCVCVSVCVSVCVCLRACVTHGFESLPLDVLVLPVEHARCLLRAVGETLMRLRRPGCGHVYPLTWNQTRWHKITCTVRRYLAQRRQLKNFTKFPEVGFRWPSIDHGVCWGRRRPDLWFEREGMWNFRPSSHRTRKQICANLLPTPLIYLACILYVNSEHSNWHLRVLCERGPKGGRLTHRQVHCLRLPVSTQRRNEARQRSRYAPGICLGMSQVPT